MKEEIQEGFWKLVEERVKELPDDFHKEELDHFARTRIPRCQKCKKDMVNAKDSITKKVSPYMWKTTCNHSKNLRLMIG